MKKNEKYFEGMNLAMLWMAFAFVTLCSCQKQAEKVADNVFYTCSMDPQIMEKKPGKCPICKMELTKITIDANTNDELKLSDQQIALANIKTEKVKQGTIGNEKLVNAELVADQNQSFSINSKIAGRIDKLYFKNVGDEVKAGQLLYEIYSEDLQASQKEYVEIQKQLAKEPQNENYLALQRAIINKWKLWGFDQNQIQQMTKSSGLKTTIPICSKQKGIITNLQISEGDYVKEGSPIFELTNNSTLWAEAELYANELQTIALGQPVLVKVVSFPNELIKGTISFVEPQLSTQSKIVKLRVQLNNKNGDFRPGMQANIVITMQSHSALLVKSKAVLQDGNSAAVWVKLDNGSFKRREVKVGILQEDAFEITEGLTIGEEVVVSGAYLLNSEYIFRRGTNASEEHQDHADRHDQTNE